MFVRPANAAPAHCEIEIINDSGHEVIVHGILDDGRPLASFRIFRADAPHFIDLFYHGYCHRMARIRIEAVAWPAHHIVYNAVSYQGSTIRISR